MRIGWAIGLAALLLLLCAPAEAQNMVDVRVYVPSEAGGLTAGAGGVSVPEAGSRVGIGRLPAPVPPGVRRPGGGAGSARPPRPSPAPIPSSARVRLDDRPFSGGTAVYLTHHSVTIRIVDGVAITEIDQTFHNNSSWQMEGIYECPLPARSVLRGFSIFMGKREVHGTVMSRAEARRIYDEITRRRRDPGIVELDNKDDSKIRTRIFPIPARGDMRVKMSYAHPLHRVGGQYVARVHLRALDIARRHPLEKLTLSARVESSWPLRRVFTGGYGLDTKTSSDGRTWSGKSVLEDIAPTRDFEVRIISHREDPTLALRVVPARRQGESYFMVSVASGHRSLTDLELDFEGAGIQSVYPARIRFLGPGREARFFGKVTGKIRPTAVLRAKAGTETVELRTSALRTSKHSFVASLWALHRVREILKQGRPSDVEELEIVRLGESHGILTPYTAFLAK